MKSIVVISTYNEIENIERIINKIHEVIPEMHVLVVDDNSPDGTSQAIEKMMSQDERVFLLKRAGKIGLGTAYCEGFTLALERNYEAIFEMDADFSHDPKELPNFLEQIKEHDLVIGSRYISGVNVVNWPLRRLVLSYGANIYSRIITGMPINDATGGFNVFAPKH